MHALLHRSRDVCLETSGKYLLGNDKQYSYIFDHMKHRITYLQHDGESGIDPSTIGVQKDSIHIPRIKAAKEWRVTIGLQDLPPEVWLN